MENLIAFVPSLILGAFLLWPRAIVKGSIVNFGFSASEEDVRKAFEKHFLDGKRAADFSSMIMQSAFSQFAFTLLMNKSKDENLKALESFVLLWSSYAFIALYIYLIFKIGRIVILFFLGDAAKNTTILGSRPIKKLA